MPVDQMGHVHTHRVAPDPTSSGLGRSRRANHGHSDKAGLRRVRGSPARLRARYAITTFGWPGLS
jgi:hypothetical protein